MRQLVVIVLLIAGLTSCSKQEYEDIPPAVIPDNINGFVNELTVTPSNITTPDKGLFLMALKNSLVL